MSTFSAFLKSVQFIFKKSEKFSKKLFRISEKFRNLYKNYMKNFKKIFARVGTIIASFYHYVSGYPLSSS